MKKNSLIFILFFSINVSLAQVFNPYGILLNAVGLVTPTQAVKLNLVRDSLRIPFARTQEIMKGWGGSVNSLYTAYNSAGIKAVVNINYGSPALYSIPFPTNLSHYSDTLRLILNAYQSPSPELIVIENEELNVNYHSGFIRSYFNMLDSAATVVHARGLKLTNGGLPYQYLTLRLWQSLYYDSLDYVGADAYAKMALPASWYNALPTISPARQVALNYIDSCLDAYRTLNLDYVNFHWYGDTRYLVGVNDPLIDTANYSTMVLKQTVDYLQARTGKIAITNEVGYDFHSSNYVPEMLKFALDYQMPYFIWYSGETAGKHAVAINEANGTLRPGGKAFQCFIDSVYYSGSGGCYTGLSTTTAIEENKASNNVITCNPNPANEKLFIRSNEIVIKKYEIKSITGQLIQASGLSTDFINVKELLNGIYFICFYDSNNKAYMQKLIKN